MTQTLSFSIGLVFVLAAVGCHLDPKGKTSCQSQSDCANGNVCQAQTCLTLADQCTAACASERCSAADVANCQSTCTAGTSLLSPGCVQCILSRSDYVEGSAGQCTFILAKQSDCSTACPMSMASQYAAQCMTACVAKPPCTDQDAMRCEIECIGATNGLSAGCAQCILSNSDYVTSTGGMGCTFVLADPKKSCPMCFPQ